MATTKTKGLSDSEALLAFQELMDGVEWTPDTLDKIAEILLRAGYRVRDLNDVDLSTQGKRSGQSRLTGTLL